MRAILSVLNAIASFAEAIGKFVISTFNSLMVLLTNIPNYLTFLINSFSVVPLVVFPFLLASISIYVVYLVIGRN